MRLAVPYTPDEWIASRSQLMQDISHNLTKAVRSGTLPHGSAKDGKLIVECLQANTPEGSDDLVLYLYQRLPEIRITDILLEEDADLGLSKMAEASKIHNFCQSSRLYRWHFESEAINRALAIVIDGQYFLTTRQGEAMNMINAKFGNRSGLEHTAFRWVPFIEGVFFQDQVPPGHSYVWDNQHEHTGQPTFCNSPEL